MYYMKSRIEFVTVGLLLLLLLSLVGIKTTGANELMVVEHQGHPQAIPNELVVMFVDYGSMVNALEETINLGGEVLHTYPAINGFAVKTTDDSLDFLRTNRMVTTLEANISVRVSEKSNPLTNQTATNWGVDFIDGTIDGHYTHNRDFNGSGVNVYLFDSGIDETVNAISGRVFHAFDDIEDGNKFCGDHGTSVATIVGGDHDTGVASGAALHSIRVLDCDNTGDIAGIISAMQWVLDNAEYPAVVNLSIATYGSTVYNHTTERLVDAGITVVASAGNDNRFDACDVSPAGANGVLTVGAVDIDNAVGWFNSTAERGCLDVYAPGVDINMVDENGVTENSSGTSYAAPFVSGCVARYLQYKHMATPDEISTLIETASEDGTINCSFVDTEILEGNATNITPLSVQGSHTYIHQSHSMYMVYVLCALLLFVTVNHLWEGRKLVH